MYFPLVLIVGLVWLWLSGGVFYGYRKRAYGAAMLLGSVGLFTVAAIGVLFGAGPYWQVIYDSLVQPG